MKKAFLTVASSRRMDNVGLLVQSAQCFYPEYEPIVYQLDIQEPGEQAYRVLSAHTLFEEKAFLRQAFSFSESDFEQVVLIKALGALFDEGYQDILVASWGVKFKRHMPCLSSPQNPNTISYLLDSTENVESKLNAEFVINSEPHFYAPVFRLTAGSNTTNFMEFCGAKLDYLASQGIKDRYAIGFAADNIKQQAAFYSYWFNYARLFVTPQYKWVENLCLQRNKGLENLEVQCFTPMLLKLEQLETRGEVLERHRALSGGLASAREYVQSMMLQYYSQAGLQLLAEYKAAYACATIEKAYRYSSFEDGTPLEDIIRAYYTYNYRLAEKCGDNPFSCPHKFIGENAVTGDADFPLLSAAMDAVWLLRTDVQKIYPDHLRGNRLAFAHWFVDYAAKELDLPDSYIHPAVLSLQEYRDKLQLQAASRSFTKKLGDKLKSLMGKKSTIPSYLSGVESSLPGVNLCGYIRGDFGVGEACRILAKSLQAVGIPFTIVDFNPPVDRNHTYTNHSWDASISNEFKYNTNILLTNAPGTRSFVESVAPSALEGRYNIGFWYWELAEFPDNWLPFIEYVDELWTSSEFTADAFRSATSKPVWVVPCCVELDNFTELSRTDFGLQEDAFTFLMMYDAMSFNERKNPEGVLDAFLQAFEGVNTVQLVIKVSAPENWDNSDPLLQRASQHSNVVVLKGTYPREKVNALLACCDVFVSLHRSEGFGLGPAEAMYLGKPAIVTNWSGNTQYMTPDNCCPVQYTLVEITENFGEYRRGRCWAQPDIDQAAGYMRRLANDPEYYHTVAAKGKATIHEQFSAKATGECAAQRLKQLKRIQE